MTRVRAGTPEQRARIRAEVLADRRLLAERFPACFTAPGERDVAKRPLRCGIDKDLFAAGLPLSRTRIRRAIHDYTFGPRYWDAILADGARRVDLRGAVVPGPDGDVTEFAREKARTLQAKHEAWLARRRAGAQRAAAPAQVAAE